MVLDIGRVLSFSFAWLRDRKSLSYAAGFWIIAALMSIGAFVFAADLTGVRTIATGGDYAYAVVSVVLAFALVYVEALVYLFALRKGGFGNIAMDARNFARFIVVLVWFSVSVFISWYNRKFVPLLVAVLVLLGAGFLLVSANPTLGFLLIALGVLCTVAYFVVVMYNYIRLVFSHMYFLSRDQPIAKSFRDSLSTTKGSTLGIFGVLLLMGFIGYVIYTVAFAVLLLVYVLVAAGTGVSLLSLFTNPGSLIWVSIALPYAAMPLLLFIIIFTEVNLLAQLGVAAKKDTLSAQPVGTVSASGARRPLAKRRASKKRPAKKTVRKKRARR